MCIIPHARPKAAFITAFAKRIRFGILPKILTLDEVIDLWFMANGQTPKPYASMLDCIELLYRAVQRVANEDHFVHTHFGSMDRHTFWPWGKMLYTLFEEIYRQGKTPTDLRIPEDMPKPTQILCQALGHIHRAYVDGLAAFSQSTHGLTLLTMTTLPKIPTELLPTKQRLVALCGFSMPDAAEEALFFMLWEQGAIVCVQGDVGLCSYLAKVHYACHGIDEWLERWHTYAEEVFPDAPKPRPVFRFFAGYDAHAELNDLTRILAQTQGKSTAIVLASEALLLPVLHHVSWKNINISMGYPLHRTLFGEFITSLVKAFSRKHGDTLYWRDLLHIVRHPFGLCFLENPKELEEAICSGQSWQSVAMIKNPFLELCLGLGNTTDLFDLAEKLDVITKALLENTAISWPNPLEKEAVILFQQRIVTTLRSSLVAKKRLPGTLQQRILTELLANERIPFASESQQGLQILGLLETRLMDYEIVIILDATDDLVPGNPGQDALVPDAAKKLLGLPTLSDRQLRSAYNFFRLCYGSKNAHLLWQEGETQSASEGARKSKSRFVEQLIWEEEKLRHCLLEDEVERADVFLATKALAKKSLHRTAAIQEKLSRVFANGISATVLDQFLECPYKFAHSYILDLKTPAEVNEGDAPDAVGSFIHGFLCDLLKPYEGKVFSGMPREAFESALDKAFHGKNCPELPATNSFLLRQACETLLWKYIGRQKETTVLKVETDVRRTFVVGKSPYPLRGKIDRIDHRETGIVVLDYKTGKLKLPKKDVWEERELFARLEEFAATAEPEQVQEQLAVLRETMPSVQLPFYMVLAIDFCQNTFNSIPTDAALVHLAEGGQERPLFGEKNTLSLLERMRHAQALIGFLLTALDTVPCFEAVPDKHCSYCPYEGLCLVGNL